MTWRIEDDSSWSISHRIDHSQCCSISLETGISSPEERAEGSEGQTGTFLPSSAVKLVLIPHWTPGSSPAGQSEVTLSGKNPFSSNNPGQTGNTKSSHRNAQRPGDVGGARCQVQTTWRHLVTTTVTCGSHPLLQRQHQHLVEECLKVPLGEVGHD